MKLTVVHKDFYGKFYNNWFLHNFSLVSTKKVYIGLNAFQSFTKHFILFLNPFHATCLFYTPWKCQKTKGFSRVWKGLSGIKLS